MWPVDATFPADSARKRGTLKDNVYLIKETPAVSVSDLENNN
jgi:hypothetical protein